jgi:hypothetical protein
MSGSAQYTKQGQPFAGSISRDLRNCVRNVRLTGSIKNKPAFAGIVQLANSAQQAFGIGVSQ